MTSSTLYLSLALIVFQVSDSSGISIQTVFPRLETDVGILLFGAVGGIQIPPQQEESSTLVDVRLPDAFSTVTIVAEQLHMHLIGTGMYVEILDENEDFLQELLRNDVYDYNNQKLNAVGGEWRELCLSTHCICLWNEETVHNYSGATLAANSRFDNVALEYLSLWIRHSIRIVFEKLQDKINGCINLWQKFLRMF